jgi:hypothetical protein
MLPPLARLRFRGFAGPGDLLEQHVELIVRTDEGAVFGGQTVSGGAGRAGGRPRGGCHGQDPRCLFPSAPRTMSPEAWWRPPVDGQVRRFGSAIRLPAPRARKSLEPPSRENQRVTGHAAMDANEIPRDDVSSG